MMIDRDTDRILRNWIHDGVAPMPDRLLDTVLGGLPHVHQRRRLPFPGLWFGRPLLARAVLVSLVVLALAAGLVLVAGSRYFQEPRPLPVGEELPLAAGSYVAQGTFPVRFAISLPAGWLVAESTNDVVTLARDEPEPRTELQVTWVDALYVDPCRTDLGLNESFGASSADLAAALAALPGVVASPVNPTSIDGRLAASVSVTAPASLLGCPGFDESFLPIWSLPQAYGLAQSTNHRFWTVEVDGRPFVLAARLGSAAGERDIDTLVASIDFDHPPVPQASGSPLPTLELLPTMPVDVVVPPGAYSLQVVLYGIYEEGRPERLPGPHDAAFEVLPGWFATPRGIAAEAEAPASASLAVWTVSTVYLDPCRSHTGGRRDASTLRDVAGVAAALSAWWPPTPDRALTGAGYVPPEAVPRASEPRSFGWIGSSREVVLDVPDDMRPADCEGGTYRIWSDPAGVARTAQPGEHIKLWIGDAAPAVVVVEAAYLPSASTLDARAVDAMLHTMWVGLRPLH